MSNAALKPDRQQAPHTETIVVDEVFPHAPEAIWKVLTTGDLIGRWLMEPVGFEPVKGKSFTYRTKPAGPWDGTIHCQVLEAIPNERLVYSWKGGHEGNVGYGAPLDTVVTFTLSRVQGGTRLPLVHSGFVSPTNDSALTTMGAGWKKVVKDLGAITAEQAGEKQ